MKKKHEGMGLAKTFLAIGIAIVFAVFVSYGLYVVYEPPRYEDTTNTCWQEHNCQRFLDECRKDSNSTRPIADSCWDRTYNSPEYQQCQQARDQCNQEYQMQTEGFKHARNSFYILIIIALASIIAGKFINQDGIGSGLIGGGVLIALYALIYTAQYWFTFNKYFKLIALGVVLAVLIYVGYQKSKK
jgi:hypothetical protein